jgi:hypothetical protein
MAIIGGIIAVVGTITVMVLEEVETEMKKRQMEADGWERA